MTRVLACLMSFVLGVGASVAAAQASGRADPNAPESNRYLKVDDPKTWEIRSSYIVYPARVRGRQMSATTRFPTLEVVAPFVERSAGSWLPEVPSNTISIGINAVPGDPFEPKVLRAPGTGAPYASFRLNQVIEVDYLWYEVRSEITCAETEFDESAAKDLPWPAEWPAEAKVWLAHDPVFDVPDDRDGDEVQALLDRWVQGGDPKALPPVQLAKFLTGSVLEHVRIVRRPTERPDSPPLRVTSSGASLGGTSTTLIYSTDDKGLEGSMGSFNVLNASQIAADPKGSENDLTNLLTAVLRRAGIPARTVIGIDNNESGDKRLKSWVEFAIVAPDVKGVIWIPVDVWELKGGGRRAQDYDRPWKHFGTCEMLRYTAPISFHFHPPANYRAWQGAGLFGVKHDQDLPEYARQSAMFVINGKANRNP